VVRLRDANVLGRERTTMRTIPIPPVVLCLLMPLFALAQSTGLGPTDQQVSHSPLSWYWLAVLAIALVAFVWSAMYISRRKGGPGGPSSRTPVS
jgi:hypothetical protein